MSDEAKVLSIFFLCGAMLLLGFIIGLQNSNRLETKNRIEPDLSIQVVDGVSDTTFIYIKQD